MKADQRVKWTETEADEECAVNRACRARFHRRSCPWWDGFIRPAGNP